VVVVTTVHHYYVLVSDNALGYLSCCVDQQQAELYRMKREHANAEPLFVEAVQRLEQALGPEHPSVGFTLHNLASTYLQQRKFEEAQSCYEVFSFDGTQKILSLVN
jgi:tetratricopeptide (TPR) repeat protein